VEPGIRYNSSMRHLIIALSMCSALCQAQVPYERLAATAKLWVYVKYFHPRVTATDVDWDRAFTVCAPKVLQAKTDDEFAAVIAEMLSRLKDPATRVMPSSPVPQAGDLRNVFAVKHGELGATIVRLEAGAASDAIRARDSLIAQIAGVGPVVFDLRGSRMANYLMPSSLPVSKAVSVSTMMRRHSGYARLDGSSGVGYHSSWEMKEIARLQPVANPIRPVFLVNSNSSLPLIALAIQDAGAGAIVSEDAISEEQAEVSSPVTVWGALRAMVRTQEFSYGGGATGVSASAVLNKTGDEALKAAAEIARSGNWPTLKARPKLDVPAALFAEKSYSDDPYPSAEYRMLAAARTWGVFNYFHPYKHLYGEDWDAVLAKFLPDMARAGNSREYHLAVAEMVAHTHDTHCFVSSRELADFYGAAPASVEIRWIENQPVVTRVFDRKLMESVQPGDIVTKIGGEPVQKRMDELSRHIAASTPQSMMSRVMQLLLNGPDGSDANVSFQTRDSAEREVQIRRGSENWQGLRRSRSGEVFRRISEKVGYVDLERLTNAQVDAMFDQFRNTDAIIMDMRGYPQGTAWTVAPRLGEKTSAVAAEFRRNVVSPETIESNYVTSLLFQQRIPVIDKPRYQGKTVMLIDERAISQSEHSGLFYRAANGTVFVGSPTTGANGDVTFFFAPGGIRINFSGHDVRWPDGKQLQRVGLLPDIEVRPTIEGIRAGRDEVLERALAYVEQGR
jgi:C-terminal processing protease CtpA/Prc